jgi:serine/threonine protein kinase
MDANPVIKSGEILTPIGYYIASELFIEILESIYFLHQQNPPIIHRDLKSENNLLKKSNEIADFGLVAIHEFTQQSQAIDKGTPKYMAPEVIKTSKYDTKSDIYGLYVIMQEFCISDDRYFRIAINKSIFPSILFSDNEENENELEFWKKSIEMQMIYATECLKESFLNDTIVMKY